MPYVDKTDTLYASYEFETKTKTLESCDTRDKSCLYMAGTIHSCLQNKLPDKLQDWLAKHEHWIIHNGFCNIVKQAGLEKMAKQ